eukprot:2231280-Amphidinium_carterae.1
MPQWTILTACQGPSLHTSIPRYSRRMKLTYSCPMNLYLNAHPNLPPSSPSSWWEESGGCDVQS